MVPQLHAMLSEPLDYLYVHKSNASPRLVATKKLQVFLNVFNAHLLCFGCFAGGQDVDGCFSLIILYIYIYIIDLLTRA